MIDTFHLPYNDNNVRVFTVNSSGSTGWQVWNKPQNAKFVHMLVIGGGGGGGGGVGATTNRNGGGGGASSALAGALYMGYMVPDTLFVSVGKGGSGGASGTNGGAGELSFVSCLPDTGATNCYLVSGQAPAGGGLTAVGASTAGSIFATSQAFNSYNALVDAIAGQAGGTGVASAAGASITISTIPLTGGAAGGGATSTTTAFTGGSINAFSFMPIILGGAIQSAGSGGYVSSLLRNYTDTQNMFLMTGGAGGGSSAAGTGGSGGKGAYGCGGGGGGAGTTSSGGRGGDGGDGLVIITAW